MIIITDEFARARSPGNDMFVISMNHVPGTLIPHGSEAQKERWLPKVASGEIRLQAFGVTEPTSGTDTTRIQTFAKRVGDKYVVNGSKIWISRAEHSDLMVLLCRTSPRDDAGKTSDGMSVLLVDMREAKGTPDKNGGLTIKPVASMTLSAFAPIAAPSSAAMRSPSMSTSPIESRPLAGSMTRPPLMSVFISCPQ